MSQTPHTMAEAIGIAEAGNDKYKRWPLEAMRKADAELEYLRERVEFQNHLLHAMYQMLAPGPMRELP